MEVRNRVQATLRFTLKGNLLTVTHEPDAFRKNAGMRSW